MTDAVATDAVGRRRRFAKRWLIAAAVGLAGLAVILVGVFLLADDTEAPCSCSPVPAPTASTSVS